MTRLGEVLKQRRDFIQLDDLREYTRPRVQLHAQGIVVRDSVPGAMIKTKKQQVCRAGEFLVAEIDAKVGGFGLVPPELDGAIVSSHYFLFEVDERKLDRRFLDYFSRTRAFRGQVEAQGSTNYAAIRPAEVLGYEIPLPPLPEQRRVVARIEEMAGLVSEAKALRGAATAETGAVLASRLNSEFGNPYAGIAGGRPIESWKRLQDVTLDVADGPHVTPSYVAEGVPFITVLNITGGRVRFADHKFISREDHALFQRRARAECGDVLISKDGTIGIPCLVDAEREFSFFVSVALIKPRRDALRGDFLVWALRAPYLQERMIQRSRGDMIRHLVLREIRDLVVPVPSLEVQASMVVDFDELQEELDLLGRHHLESSVALDALLPAVLDRAVRGEL